MEWSVDHLAEKYLSEDRTFFDRTQKTITVYKLLSKSVSIFWTLAWTQKKQFRQNCQIKVTPKVRKALARSPNLLSKRNILSKNLFRFRTFLCICSMQFSQTSRDFLPAFWKSPTQKPQLIVVTGLLFRNYIIPQRAASKIDKVVSTIP